MTVFISPGPRQHSAFRLHLKTHMRSAVLCWSLNNSVWFQFDWNVQYYFVLIRKTFIDIFVALTKLRKKIITHIVPQKNTQNVLCTKKTTQNFTCMWPEHSTIASSWMLKCNTSAVVVVAEKMWISQNILWLPWSSRMSR